MAEQKQEAKIQYDETDHILRNRGNNVATPDRCCSFNKSVKHYQGNCLQSAMSVSTYSYALESEILQINFDRAYILNTFKFWLYDGDARIFKYKIEISKDGKLWKQIVNDENKTSWQTVQFDEQFVKHVRFIEGTNNLYGDIVLCKFSAFFDYSLPFI